VYKVLAAWLLTFSRAWLYMNDKCTLVAVVTGRISIFRPIYALGDLITSSMNRCSFALQHAVSAYLLTFVSCFFHSIYSFKIRYLIAVNNSAFFLSKFSTACFTGCLFQSQAQFLVSSAHGKVKPHSIATLKGNFYETNSRCRRRGGWS
jgi:hypothetical protein